MKNLTNKLPRLIPLAIPVVLFVFFSIAADGFGFQSLPIILNQSLIPYVLSLGIFLQIMAGLFDLSVGTQMYTVGIFACALAQHFGGVGLIVGCIAGGILLGVIMGLIYTSLKISSMILSLGMVFVWEFLQWICFSEVSSVTLDSGIQQIGAAPYSYIFALVAMALFFVLYNYTSLGYQIRLVGNNEMTAASVGVKASKIKFLTFVCNGLFVGIAAILQSCYSGVMTYMGNMSSVFAVFKPIMIVMIAIAFLRFSSNMVYNLLCGILAITIIFNGLISLGLPSTYQTITLGVFLLIVLGVTGNISRWTEALRRYRAKKKTETLSM